MNSQRARVLLVEDDLPITTLIANAVTHNGLMLDAVATALIAKPFDVDGLVRAVVEVVEPKQET